MVASGGAVTMSGLRIKVPAPDKLQVRHHVQALAGRQPYTAGVGDARAVQADVPGCRLLRHQPAAHIHVVTEQVSHATYQMRASECQTTCVWAMVILTLPGTPCKCLVVRIPTVRKWSSSLPASRSPQRCQAGAELGAGILSVRLTSPSKPCMQPCAADTCLTDTMSGMQGG